MGEPKANKTKRAEVIALKALGKCTKTLIGRDIV